MGSISKIGGRSAPLHPDGSILSHSLSKIEGYRLFRETLKPKCGLIYYPCCGGDFAPVKAFPDSRIIYVEQISEFVEALTSKGIEAHNDYVEQFNLAEDPDIILFHEQVVDVDSIPAQVKVGGYILCDDYNEAAATFSAKPNFRLEGIIKLMFGARETREVNSNWLGRRPEDLPNLNENDLFVFKRLA